MIRSLTAPVLANVISGVNTGFGGSADTRTSLFKSLQSSLLQHLQSGILVDLEKLEGRPGQVDIENHSIPSTWVRAAMLVRSNSIMRGHSAVSYPVIEALINLIRKDFVPVIPLRGSISASGDLMPLSYVAGALEGNPDILVRTSTIHSHRIVSAKDALKMAGMEPVSLGPKEGLGLVNGTAMSAAVASLALYETNHLTVLLQALTSMGVEAMMGQAESFHPFVSQVRPHQGQVEAAQNILIFLQGSKLAKGLQGEKNHVRSGLCQDRYSFRTASQWIGPQLEDIILANRQVEIELNSTTDNPLIDVVGGDIFSGGNFQAVSITSAMEKTRTALQMFGRLLYSQCSEIINPALNNGLPPNLAADNPSLSFTMKGIDVNMASYMSELAFLASPVSSHVQSAEMNNQSVNSLALVSARFTMQAVQVLSLMCASCIYILCQALDLRVRQIIFFGMIRPKIDSLTSEVFAQCLSFEEVETLKEYVWADLSESWSATAMMDAEDRIIKVVERSLATVTNHFLQTPSVASSSTTFLERMIDWKCRMLSLLSKTHHELSANYNENRNTADYLGHGSKSLYHFVRNELAIPFHEGLIEHPVSANDQENTLNGRPKLTIGSWVSKIYMSLRSGELHKSLMLCRAKE